MSLFYLKTFVSGIDVVLFYSTHPMNHIVNVLYFSSDNLSLLLFLHVFMAATIRNIFIIDNCLVQKMFIPISI